MRSRVMPGSFVTMERRVPVRRLKSVDLPTLGRPTITIDGNFSVIMIFALSAIVSHRRRPTRAAREFRERRIRVRQRAGGTQNELRISAIASNTPRSLATSRSPRGNAPRSTFLHREVFAAWPEIRSFPRQAQALADQ